MTSLKKTPGAALPLTGPRALLGRYRQNGVNQPVVKTTVKF